MTTTEAGTWGHDTETIEDSFGFEWIRTHRLYCLTLVAIVMATLMGASWADQPHGQMGVTSSSSGMTVDAGQPQPER